MLNESISVVLAVKNAQSWLRSEIENLLDHLAELTSSFEIIVVDINSQDSTIEELEDLKCRFPQLRFQQTKIDILPDDATKLGMESAQGEMIFANVEGARFAPEDLRKLWALRSDKRLLSARSNTRARRIDNGLIEKLTQWAHRMTDHMHESTSTSFPLGAVQMVRREAIEQLRESHDSQIEISHISHQQLTSPKLVDKRRSRLELPARNSKRSGATTSGE